MYHSNFSLVETCSLSFYFPFDLQGYKHQKAYMIGENPMPSTARNMLKILYDRKCGAVVMLSGLVENGEVYICVVLCTCSIMLDRPFTKL